MRLVFSIALLIFLGTPLVVAAEDDLIIEISSGVVRPITLAIADFKTDNKQLGKSVRDIVINNFKLSGHLTTIPHAEMPNQPFRENQIIYSAWRSRNAEYIVFGEIERAGRNEYQMNISVADVLGESIRDSKVFTFSARYNRDFAHYISDYVYKVITGLDGSFSTKIAYIRREFLRKATNRRKARLRYSLIVADADGARERTILTSDEPLSSPSWSPDGKKIAYVSFEYGYPYIFIQDIEKGWREIVTNYRGINSAPAWSPDGNSLAVVLSQGANADIFLINLASKSYKRITRHKDIDTEPSWSQDGSKLLFTSDRSGIPQIYEFDMKTQEIKHLIKNKSYSAGASYTRNNEEVVLINLISGRYSVIMYNLKTGKVTEVSKTRLDDSPSISPDGNRVIYSAKVGNKNLLSIASVDLGNSVYLNGGSGDITSVAWSPFIFKFNF